MTAELLEDLKLSAMYMCLCLKDSATERQIFLNSFDLLPNKQFTQCNLQILNVSNESR